MRTIKIDASLERRFWAKVDASPGHGPEGKCWVWIGCLSAGYGSIGVYYDGRMMPTSAHRVAWALWHRDDPGDLMVLHRCDFRPCVRPSHLFLGNADNNTQDMIAKGRHGSVRNPDMHLGVQNGNAMMTEAIVREIRLRREHENLSCMKLAQEYGVSRQAIDAIVRRVNWKHVL
jgi:hypothetical protein